MCKDCGIAYTPQPKRRAYSEETRTHALKIYYSGVSERGVGKILGMSKANVYNWIKNAVDVENLKSCLELDEMYWFVRRKGKGKTRENVYLMTAVSRSPRQIVGFDVACDKSSARIQDMIDSAPEAETYYTDGYCGYIDVIYPGTHCPNTRDKSDTYTVEGVNADLRHYIPLLARRNRCFARKIETLQAVIEVFVDAYNKFREAKGSYRLKRTSGEFPFSILDFL